MAKDLSAVADMFRVQLEEAERSLGWFESGKMQLLQNGANVSDAHMAHLRASIANLEEAIAILERPRTT